MDYSEICRKVISCHYLTFRLIYAILVSNGEQKKRWRETTMYDFEEIVKTDPEIANAIKDEMNRQNSHIELIASENWVSKAVMAAMGSPLTNKLC